MGKLCPSNILNQIMTTTTLLGKIKIFSCLNSLPHLFLFPIYHNSSFLPVNSPMSSSRENSSSSMIYPSLPSHGSVFPMSGVPSKGKLPLPPRPASLTNSLPRQILPIQDFVHSQGYNIQDKAGKETLTGYAQAQMHF